MKNIFNLKNTLMLSLACGISINTMYAQAPQKFNYQGIARDAKGNPLANQQMQLKLSILPAADATEADYVETQLVKTNEFGLYTLQVGNGTSVKGEMKNVKWETGNTYIKVAIDPKGGSSFVDAGTTQLLSVPYAMYADKAGVAKSTGTTNGGTRSPGVSWDQGGNIVTCGDVIGSQSGSPDPAVVFQWNGAYSGSINSTNNSIGGASMQPDFSGSCGAVTGSCNNAIGYGSMNNMVGGNNNNAIGCKTMADANPSNNNNAMGTEALRYTQADENTGIGDHSLYGNIYGKGNTGLGAYSGITNYKGDYNTLVGHSADVILDNLVNASAFGWDAKVKCDNSIVLGSINGTTGNGTNVGIGTVCPQARLDVIGRTRTTELEVTNGAGGAGNVLTDDGSGNAVWASVPCNCPPASATSWSLGGNATGPFVFGTTVNADIKLIRGNQAYGTWYADNIGTGRGSLNSVPTGTINTAYGLKSLGSTTTGANNTAVGYSLPNNTTGSDNTAIGNATLLTNVIGVRNTALGATADVSFNGIGNATMLGFNTRCGADNATAVGAYAICNKPSGVVLGSSGSDVGINITASLPTPNVPSSRLQSVGSFATTTRAYNPTATGQSTTATINDATIIVANAAFALTTITLQNATQCPGRYITIKRANAASTGVITINGGGTNVQSTTAVTFAATATLAAPAGVTNTSITYQSDGTVWHLISKM
jgi:trimeric autotransporter adhesin